MFCAFTHKVPKCFGSWFVSSVRSLEQIGSKPRRLFFLGCANFCFFLCFFVLFLSLTDHKNRHKTVSVFCTFYPKKTWSPRRLTNWCDFQDWKPGLLRSPGCLRSQAVGGWRLRRSRHWGYGDWISPISAANDVSKKWKREQKRLGIKGPTKRAFRDISV